MGDHGSEIGTGSIVEISTERDLYVPTKRFISLRLGELLARKFGTNSVRCFEEIVATASGGAQGRWTRPDVAALAVSRGKYVPYWRADLHTFEVKTAGAVDETAIGEASAHGRFAHFAWLVFQAVGRAAPDSHLYGRLLSAASPFGIGVVTFQDPDNAYSWHVEVWPERTSADNAMADAFVQRFSPVVRDNITHHLNALGWKVGEDE